MAGITGILKNKKTRPWIIGGMVLVGAIVLFVMMRAKGAASADAGASGGATGPSEALQAAQLQAQTSVNLAQIAANADMVRSTGEIEVALAGQQTSLAMAQYQVQSDQFTIAAQAGVQMAGIQAQENIAKFTTDAQAGVQIAGINAQTTISQAQYKYLTDQTAINADVEKTRIGAQQNVENKKSKNSLLGGIAQTFGSVFALFSDVRMKDDVTWTGEVEARRVGGRGFDSYGRGSWTYHGQEGISYGVIAQDVRHAAPGAVIQVRQSRFMAVDYAGLPG